MLTADAVLLSDRLLPVRSDFSGDPLPDLLGPPPCEWLSDKFESVRQLLSALLVFLDRPSPPRSITAAAALQSSTHPWTSRSRCRLASVDGLDSRGSGWVCAGEG